MLWHKSPVAASLLLLAGLVSPGHAQTETADGNQWRPAVAEHTVYLDTADGRVVIELNPAFAPATVTQFKHLVREKFYDGLRFYRVIDGFVAQGGDGSDLSDELPTATLPAEFERPFHSDLNFISVQKNDLFAAETGFIDGFAVARDAAGKTVWLTHCPGVIAMARGNDPDSGGTDFYIVIGQAPRYLDRNLTIFGRVVKGMDVVQKIHRGPRDANGIIADQSDQTPITHAYIAADIPADQRLAISVMDTNHPAFAALLSSRRQRTHEFFHHRPPPVLDVCQLPVPVRAK